MHNNLDLIPPVNVTPIADAKIESNKDTVVKLRQISTDIQDRPGPPWYPMPSARTYVQETKQIPYIQSVLKEVETLAKSVNFTVASLSLTKSEGSKVIDKVTATVEMDRNIKNLSSFEYYLIQHIAESMIKDMVSRMDKELSQVTNLDLNLIGLID